MNRLLYIMLPCLLILTACRDRGLEELPTPINPSIRGTEIILTENAPPPDFGSVQFPNIDDHLEMLSGWHYTVDMEFDGVFTQVDRRVSGRVTADVWYNQIASARRVIVKTEGDLLGLEEPEQYEAVQLGPDDFLVERGACLSNAEESAEIATRVNAGSLVGGVNNADAMGQPQQRVNNEDVWRYTLNFDQLNLPQLVLNSESKILAFNGELWVAPEHGAVIRYYMTIDVENALVFTNVLSSALPVTGRLIVRYDLNDVGDLPNITVPFGC